MSKWFCDTSAGAAQEQSPVVLLLEGVLVSWSLVMDERGRHKDLCGSGRRSMVVYNETRGPTGGPQVVETLYNI
jgi:hypothetical protein